MCCSRRSHTQQRFYQVVSIKSTAVSCWWLHWPSSQSQVYILIFCVWMLMGKDTPDCLCVAHVFAHVLKYQKSTEQNPALHCKTKHTACQLRCGLGSLGGVAGASLVVCAQGCGEPVSTNCLCQLRNGTWGSVVVLKYGSMSGVKFYLAMWSMAGGGGVGAEGREWRRHLRLSPSRPLCWNRREPQRWRGVCFQPLRPVVWEPRSAWFRGHRLTSQQGPSCLSAGYDHPLTHTPALLLNKAEKTKMLTGLSCSDVYRAGRIKSS